MSSSSSSSPSPSVLVNAVFPAAAASLAFAALPSEKLVESREVSTGYLKLPAQTAKLSTGVWEHAAGSSFDEEAEEVFVIISGRGKVTVLETGQVLDLAPGVIGVLQPGTKTRWDIEENLRKAWIVPNE